MASDNPEIVLSFLPLGEQQIMQEEKSEISKKMLSLSTANQSLHVPIALETKYYQPGGEKKRRQTCGY